MKVFQSLQFIQSFFAARRERREKFLEACGYSHALIVLTDAGSKTLRQRRFQLEYEVETARDFGSYNAFDKGIERALKTIPYMPKHVPRD